MAPRRDLWTDRMIGLLETIPVPLRTDPDYQSIMYCTAREMDRLEAAIDWVRRQANPLTADLYGLREWARVLKMPRPSSSDPLVAVRQRVVDRWRAISGTPELADWVRRVTQRLGGNPWTWDSMETNPALPPWTMRIELSIPLDSPLWTQWTAAIRYETPSDIALLFQPSEGFILDVSQLDEDQFSV